MAEKESYVESVRDRLAGIHGQVDALSERVDRMDTERKMAFMDDLEFLRSQHEIIKAKLHVLERSDWMARMDMKTELEEVLHETETVLNDTRHRLQA